MTHAEIYQAMARLIPQELMDKYGHLCYAEMAEVPELAQWAKALSWAEEQWANADPQEAVFS